MKDRRLSIALQAAVLVSLLIAAMASAPVRDAGRADAGAMAGTVAEQAAPPVR